MLRHAAQHVPDRTLVAQRSESGGWRRLTYGEVRQNVDAIAQALLRRKLKRPVLILAGNSIEHLLMALACQSIGVPYVPVSTGYSLREGEQRELRHIAQTVRPSLVLVNEVAVFSRAIAAVREAATTMPEVVTIASGDRATDFAELADTKVTSAVEHANAGVGPDTVAKYLFTSGSTGTPKGVVTTHGMLCANQQMMRQAWPFLADEPPVLLDWLPWSHTFGGSHNINLAIHNCGTFFIDDGRPAPQEFEQTLSNLVDVQPTVYLNVPLALRRLAERLENDPILARGFFQRLRVLFYAAAALPQDTWNQLTRLAEIYADHPVALTTSWGATETAPAAVSAHFPAAQADCIGVPLPGVSAKLVPTHGKMEIRVKGPTVMPGYLEQPSMTSQVFDREGYFKTGDAVELVNPADPQTGLRFNGRLAEDFKLDSGTWVNSSAVRSALIEAAGNLLLDCLVTGHDKSYIAVLAWPNEPACRKLTMSRAPLANLGAHPELRNALLHALHIVNANTGSSRRIRRLTLLDEAPDPLSGEVTDKGYINQAASLARRAFHVAALFDEPAPGHILDVDA
ncbi:feruloyl-CoA synthase [Streptomyces sp. NPDC086783]|uniref:feruloyl-CoA synthase n=1 Tax=Streptomyces sp. NPDC086783 TaxID=3365758 RepID=UPI0038170A6C